MEKVNRYTRASKYDGKEIYCPKCNATNKVYHFCWSAITCDKCKEMINKTEWNLKKELEEQLMKNA